MHILTCAQNVDKLIYFQAWNKPVHQTADQVQHYSRVQSCSSLLKQTTL